MKKTQLLVLCVIMVLVTVAFGENSVEAAPQEEYYVTLSTAASTSSFYAFYACWPDAVAAVYPNVHITAIEGAGGAVSNNFAVRTGIADIGAASSSGNYDNYNGLGSFETADKTTRTFVNFQVSPVIMAVSKDSGLTSFAQLDEKRVCPGYTGTTTEVIFKALAEKMGIAPEWMLASASDAVDAYSDRQIIGMGKSSSGNYDSTIIQLQASHSVDILSLTDEEISIVTELFPSLRPYTIPIGVYNFIDHEIKTVAFYASAVSSSKMPQECGYLILKAMTEDGPGKKLRDAAFPNGANENWFENSLNDNVPLHAGMVQLMVENGYDVPAELIPPEYVAVP
jgi:TRAP transporter TAXI family solute receptor